MAVAIVTAGIILLEILGLVSAVHALRSTRTTQGTIAWIISLITFPVLSVPAYWILGRNRFQGYVSARQSGDDAVNAFVSQLYDIIARYRKIDPAQGEVYYAVEKLAQLPYTGGNKSELLIDGEATFNSILKGIDDARDYILFQFFIIKNDEIGQEVKSRLIAKAKQGLRIYFLYDEIGCYELPESYKKELQAAGVEVYNFHTRKGASNRFQINFRNHRKLVVVDGNTIWVGGHNVGDEYLGKSTKFGRWRDTHVRIDGPAAIAAQLSFVEDWYWATESLPELNWVPNTDHGDDETVLIIPSGPADELETALLMFVHAINLAQQRIWITSPYFVPDEATMSALQLAGLRGVDVRILIPDKPDHLLVFLAAFSYFEDASRTGVRFYRYTDGFLHQKVMLVDDKAATVGTANFDNRSFRLNFEITCVISDKDFVAAVERMLEQDFALSRPMVAEDVDEKSFLFKLGVRLARLAAPVL